MVKHRTWGAPAVCGCECIENNTDDSKENSDQSVGAELRPTLPLPAAALFVLASASTRTTIVTADFVCTHDLTPSPVYCRQPMSDQRTNARTDPLLNDAHCHFFSEGFFTMLGDDPAAPAPGPARDPAQDLPAILGWDPPGSIDALADRWVSELDRHGLHRVALMSSVPGDETSVAEAVHRHPRRLVGMFMVNPLAPDGVARAERGFTECRLRCACLFPAMHDFAVDNDRVRAIFETAARHDGVIFVHCGFLSVGVRKKLGLPSAFDIRRGNPLSLIPIASDFPTVPIIVPHFGAGFFRELLMAADLCPTIHVDTSSSNGWTKYIPALSLLDVYRHTLDVIGAERMLFGTDSSFFPRGWQRPVFEAQRAVVDQLGLDTKNRAALFAGNFDRVFGPAQ